MAGGIGGIGDILLRAKVIDEVQLRSALAHQAQWGGRLPTVIIDWRLASEAAVVDAIAAAARAPKIDLAGLPPSPAALAKLDAEYCRKKGVFPAALQESGKVLLVAMVEPLDLPLTDELAVKARARIRVGVASERAILAAIDQHYLGRPPAANPPIARGPSGAENLEDGDSERPMLLVDASGSDISGAGTHASSAEPTHASSAEPTYASSAEPTYASSAEPTYAEPGDAEPALGQRALTPEEQRRLAALEQMQEKGARIVRALLELCVEKGLFTLEQLRGRLPG